MKTPKHQLIAAVEATRLTTYQRSVRARLVRLAKQPDAPAFSDLLASIRAEHFPTNVDLAITSHVFGAFVGEG
jgi:hypothetical protein